MDDKQIKKLQSIDDFPDLVAYLRDELDWPIEEHDFDDLTFEYSALELGIDELNAAKIVEIKRLRPLDAHQPWGIFFVSLEPKQLPVVALRRLLSKISLKKRASANKTDQAAWHHDDILFISNFGEENERQLSFAHFAVNEEKNDLPILKVLGWDNRDTKLKIDYVVEVLKDKLIWPKDVSDTESWRQQWREAFTLRHKEVVSTSKEMAIRLAELARNIRDSIISVLQVESEKGPLRQIMETFREALIHDLDETGFADMYAQTIAYGLLSARIADPHGGNTVEHLGDHMRTNPFLRELMESFLDVGGRKRGKQKGAGLDFDELGVSEVVDLLDSANMEAVVRDFGDRNRQEDPVMHFYESFLHEYNKQLKVQRGVFYTPQPVVSYIVRSVHELLQTEFGLEDGLADTTTWGEMLKKHPDMKLPPLTDERGEKRTISPDEPFVQILDPATGTATFLVEVIDVIYNTMTARWKQQGRREKAIESLWNDYVPLHLLPRLHAYELMMAPYAIAHMKVGLKLTETGYLFEREERARIYLTNALEPWQKQLKLPTFDALAHEAETVNEVKREKRFTVVIGNPPYAINSSNTGDWMVQLTADYYLVDGEPLRERNPKVLQDDYVKFLRLAQFHISTSKAGLVGYITNHGYIDNPTFRGQRQNLASEFGRVAICDLHGNSRKREQCPDGNSDENVFDILQGVAIFLGTRVSADLSETKVSHADLWGTRETKYQFLSNHSLSTTPLIPVPLAPPFYVFTEQQASARDEFQRTAGYKDIFTVISNGFKTHRDHIALDFDRNSLEQRILDFRSSKKTDEWVRETYHIVDGAEWRLPHARKLLAQTKSWESYFTQALYRPFDLRSIYYHKAIVDRPRRESMWHMEHPNIGLIAGRQGQVVGGDSWDLVYCGQGIADTNLFYRGGIAYAPLYIYSDKETTGLDLGGRNNQKRANFKPDFLASLSEALDLPRTGQDGLPRGLTPEDIFHYAYAVFHSPSYRSRYAEFLKIDFPRLPLTGNLELFRVLAKLGGQLTALHLLESPNLKKPIIMFTGKNQVVSKVGWTPYDGGTVWLDGKGAAKNFQPGTSGFRPVPEEVWNFHIGGYKVCEKWLKDRGPKKGNPGRTLTDDDIAHYHKIIIALTETIRIMAEIDEVIEAHGGWPGAFVTDAGGAQESESEFMYPDSGGDQSQLDMVAEPKDG
jgi:hypothetical protein